VRRRERPTYRIAPVKPTAPSSGAEEQAATVDQVRPRTGGQGQQHDGQAGGGLHERHQ
jgi:hypothetical protein